MVVEASETAYTCSLNNRKKNPVNIMFGIERLRRDNRVECFAFAHTKPKSQDMDVCKRVVW